MVKGDRVVVKMKEGERIGCVQGIRAGKAKIVFDDGFTKEGYRYIDLPVGSPHIRPSDAPIPDECSRPKDDPTLGYTAKFASNGRPRMSTDGYSFLMDVLKDGKPTGIQLEDRGDGGMMMIHGRDTREFEAAIEAWGKWKGIEFEPVGTWAEIWMALDDYKGLPNVPWAILDPPYEPLFPPK